jgi:glutamine synthetase type III
MGFDFKNKFGINVFSKKTLEKYTSKSVYQNFLNALSDDNKEIVDLNLANKIAEAMKT